MGALRILAAVLGLVGAPLYALSLYSYYKVIVVLGGPPAAGAGWAPPLAAFEGAWILVGAVAAGASSLLLALSAAASGSRAYRLLLAALWLAGVLTALAASYEASLRRAPGGAEVLDAGVFAQALALTAAPYTPLLLVPAVEALRRR